MSSLNSIIFEIEKEAEKRKEELRNSYSVEIKKIEEDFQREISLLEKDKEKKVEREKENLITTYREEKEFELKMYKLSLKEKFLNEAVLKIKENIKNYPFEKKKNIYLKKIEELKRYLLAGKVFAKKGEGSDIKKLFNSDIEIIEKELEIEDGFIIEGERFSFEVSVSSIIDEIILNNKDILLSLFKQ